MFRVLAALAALFVCACSFSGGGGKPLLSARQPFILASDDFADNSPIPETHTCDGRGISPSLKWKGAPAAAKSFALAVRDPDAPSGNFAHWTVLDIPASSSGVAAGGKFPPGSRELVNDANTIGYRGPCPPSGTHRYVFTLYALDIESSASDPAGLEEFLSRHTLARAVLTGLYTRKAK